MMMYVHCWSTGAVAYLGIPTLQLLARRLSETPREVGRALHLHSSVLVTMLASAWVVLRFWGGGWQWRAASTLLVDRSCGLPGHPFPLIELLQQAAMGITIEIPWS